MCYTIDYMVKLRKQKKKLLFEEQESIREWADTIIDVVKPFVRLDHPHITYG